MQRHDINVNDFKVIFNFYQTKIIETMRLAL